jgi:lambda repressor-like predicted transcriptional regulator
MGLAATEKELAEKTTRYIKAEMKRAGVTYAELAKRLEAHGLKETEASIANKLSRGTIAATFLLATVAALEMDGVKLEDL